MPTTEELAKQFAPHVGFRFSAAYLWGSAPFRPDDEVYKIVRITAAAADRLDIVIVADGSTAPEITLSVWNPGKLKSGADDVRISAASKVSFGPDYEAVLNGDKFQVNRDGRRGDEFPKKDLPALRLVVAPS
jgi:hypothetical protein